MFRTDGVYIKTNRIKKKNLSAFFNNEDWITRYHYYCFVLDEKNEIMSIHTGVYEAEFTFMIEDFAKGNLGNHNKIKNYEIINKENKERIKYLSNDNLEVVLTFLLKGELLSVDFENMERNDKFIFFKYPLYYTQYYL
ncbi:MAG TPA: hypothetical protein VKT28_01715 [Puia sp.]|nr:hypothetical protein [Puia sp.]